MSDSVGNPVPDVDIEIRPGDALYTLYGTVKSDRTGSYRFSSAHPHWDAVIVSASRPGFLSLDPQRASCCNPEGDTRYDFSLVGVISVTPTAPTTLRVGESVELPASVVVFDNGSTRNIFLLPTSSAPAVVAVNRSDRWYAMRGMNVGVASLTFDCYGTAAVLQVRVVP